MHNYPSYPNSFIMLNYIYLGSVRSLTLSRSRCNCPSPPTPCDLFMFKFMILLSLVKKPPPDPLVIENCVGSCKLLPHS
jgi:hypothetical protein